MRPIAVLVIAAILCITPIFSGCVQEQQPQPSDFNLERARALVGRLENGTVDEVFSSWFSSAVRSQTTAAALEGYWTQTEAQYGDFLSIASVRSASEQGYDAVYVTCTFATLGTLDTKVVFDSDQRIAGLFFVPTQGTTSYELPSYVDPSAFTEISVTVGSAPWTLPGTLSLPKGDGPFPAVVLVHGSGPSDRNETVGANQPFKDVAWGLASQGIAVLRYEKRTKQYQTALASQVQTITVAQETVDDAKAAVALLQARDDIDSQRLVVLGHSLGAMLAPRIATGTSGIGGLILLAPPARPLQDLVVNQTIYLAGLDGTVSAQEQEQIEDMQESARRIHTLDIAAGDVVLGAGRAYWLDLDAYDPLAAARSVDLPLFILQGTRDYQVLFEVDFARWQAAFASDEAATLHAYNSLNHLFIPGAGPSSPQEYMTAGHVAESVVDDIAAWVKARS